MFMPTENSVVPILCFHNLSELGYYTSISPARFAALLCLLQEQFTLIGSRDLGQPAFPAGSKPPLLLTFDDGYEDNIGPLLEAAGRCACKGIVFPVAHYIGKYNDWNVKAHYRARHASRAQLQALVEAGYEIGSHTLDHINLVRLERAPLRVQIIDSKKLLEDALQAGIETISYPFGWFNQEIEQLASEHYRLGFSTLSKGGARCWQKHPHAIGRLSVGYAACFDQIIAHAKNWVARESDILAHDAA